MTRSYLIVLGYTLLGLAILMASQTLEFPEWLDRSVPIFLVFLCVNLISARGFRLEKDLRRFWSLGKPYYLVLGALAGVVVAVFPGLLSLLLGHSGVENVSIGNGASLSSAVVTLVIVGWEELWFRGLHINHCRKYLSETQISLTVGVLFMAIHALNPDIDLIETGPALFFAGATLTLLYFRYQSIWLPVGVHFGNNYSGSLLEVEIDDHAFFGSDGYASAATLGVLFFVFLRKANRTAAAAVRE